MSYQIEFRHLKYFLAVAEELHFRKAAERLFISQPGLSRQIRQLEEQLGYRLFKRSNKKVDLTKAGRYLHREIPLALKQINGILEHGRLINEGMEGEISFGYVGSAIQNIVPEILRRMKESAPNIHYSLKEMENPEQIDALLAQEIDLGFVRLDKVPRGLKIQPVFEDTFSLVLPADHALSESNFSNMAELKEEPFILFDPSYSPAYYEKVMEIFKESGFQPLISHNSVHASTIFRLVENKLGLSIVPSSLGLGYDLDIKFIELPHIPQRTVLSAVWNLSNRNPILQRVLSLLPFAKP